MAHIGSKNACNKKIQKWEFGTVINFHKIKIIHGQYALISILFSLFGLGFFGVSVVFVGCCDNVKFVELIRMNLRQPWFISS
jgi:hypothetical protein